MRVEFISENVPGTSDRIDCAWERELCMLDMELVSVEDRSPFISSLTSEMRSLHLVISVVMTDLSSAISESVSLASPVNCSRSIVLQLFELYLGICNLWRLAVDEVLNRIKNLSGKGVF